MLSVKPFIAAIICLAILLAPLFFRRLMHVALPALMRIKTPETSRDRVMMRFQEKDFNAWIFTWFKTRLDPMFAELPEFLKTVPPPSNFLDLGCGYGIAGCLLLELFEKAQAFAVDPNPARVRAATAAMGNRGRVFEGSAPDFEKPEFPDHFDLVFALDMIHFLPDMALDLTLQRIRARLSNGDFLFIRSPVKPVGAGSLKLKIYRIYGFFTRTFSVFRTPEQIHQRITNAGFEMVRSHLSGTNPELFWFIAKASAMKVTPDDSSNQERDQNHMSDDQSASMHDKKFVDLLQPTNPA
jgi:SAM-dependent methyltransferase